MAFEFPTYEAIVAKMEESVIRGDGNIIDVDKRLDPTIKNSFAFVYIRSIAGAMLDMYRVPKYILQEAFLTTATDTLEDTGKKEFGITRRGSTISKGKAVLVGTVGTPIPAGTLITGNNNQYAVMQPTSIQAYVLNITNITRTGQKARATTPTQHNLANGLLLTIVGAIQAEYNIINQEITILSETEFEFDVIGLPATPATGAIFGNINLALAPVESVLTGIDNNLTYTTVLQLTNGIAGVDSNARITFGGIQGGLDIENIADYRERVLEKKRNNFPKTSDASITSFLKDATLSGISGITRVWVLHCIPEIGKMTVYFVRDGLTNIFPSTDIVNEAHAAITNRANRLITPVTPNNYVIVSSPIPLVVNFTFATFTPNIASLKDAVRENLKFFFQENANLGKEIPSVRYNNIIMSTTDNFGNTVQNYSLITPFGSIMPQPNELPQLGIVT